MEDVSFCSIIGIAGMLLALVIAAAKLCVLRVDDYAPTHWLRKCARRVRKKKKKGTDHQAALLACNAAVSSRGRFTRDDIGRQVALCCMEPVLMWAGVRGAGRRTSGAC